MTTIKNTKENNAMVSALKTVKETQWSGTVIHDNLDKCLRAINMESSNGGWYNPTAIKIAGLSGYFMVNKDGSIFYDARVIKEDHDKFRIEYMSMSAFYDFEKKYSELINS